MTTNTGEWMTTNKIDKFLLANAPKGITHKITALADCTFCHGSGTVYEVHPYGSTTATEALTCDCVLEQLPEDFDDYNDEIEVIQTNWQGADGPEFEYDDYLDLFEDKVPF